MMQAWCWTQCSLINLLLTALLHAQQCGGWALPAGWNSGAFRGQLLLPIG